MDARATGQQTLIYDVVVKDWPHAGPVSDKDVRDDDHGGVMGLLSRTRDYSGRDSTGYRADRAESQAHIPISLQETSFFHARSLYVLSFTDTGLRADWC